MVIEVPFTTKPGEIDELLEKIITFEIPQGNVDESFIQAAGFSLESSKQLVKVLKMLGFVDDEGKVSTLWKTYISTDDRGTVLASAMKQAYSDLFDSMLCPYLEDDEVLLGYLKRNVKASPEEMELMLETFRILAEKADFQDLLCLAGESGIKIATESERPIPNVRVSPNLQVCIQVHIDPDTPDEKIETIFRNMRKYLLGERDR